MSANQPQDPHRFPPASSDLDQLLSDANGLPASDAAAFESTHGYDDLFDRILRFDRSTATDATEPVVIEEPATPQSVRQGKAGRRRPSRRTIASLALATAIVVGGASAAAAGWKSVHTGSFGHHGDTEDVPGEEFLNLAGDNMPQVAAKLAEHIPYPPGDSAAAYIPGLVRTGGLMQASGIQMHLSLDAACAWFGYWLQSDANGDAAARARATSIIEQVPTWPVIVKNDGGGTVESFEQVASAAAHGEAAPVENEVTANCTSLPRLWANK